MHVFISSLFQLSFWFVFKVVALFVNLHAYSQLSEADIELHLLRHKNLPKVPHQNNICEIPDISKFVPLVGLLARPPSILCWVILFLIQIMTMIMQAGWHSKMGRAVISFSSWWLIILLLPAPRIITNGLHWTLHLFEKLWKYYHRNV